MSLIVKVAMERQPTGDAVTKALPPLPSYLVLAVRGVIQSALLLAYAAAMHLPVCGRQCCCVRATGNVSTFDDADDEEEQEEEQEEGRERGDTVGVSIELTALGEESDMVVNEDFLSSSSRSPRAANIAAAASATAASSLKRWAAGGRANCCGTTYSSHTLFVIGMRGLLGSSSAGIFYFAMQLTQLGDATVVRFTAPVYTAIAAWCLLGERWTVHEYVFVFVLFTEYFTILMCIMIF